MTRPDFTPSATKTDMGGFALIEGLIAVLIFSLGVLGLIGLLATTTQTTTLAKARVDASFAASQRIAEIWGDLPNIATNAAETATTIPTLPKGVRKTTVAGNTVTVTVTWEMPGNSTKYSYTTIAQLVGN